ncbi:MAG: FkbM family methyltransferase [Syntrophobacteraceae bacterium]
MNEALMHIKRCAKSCLEADFLPTVFGKSRNEAVTGELPVVLFGAGSAGKELLPVFRTYGVEPVCFCDSDPSRTGTVHCGLPVISTSELGRKHGQSLIVLTMGQGRHAVRHQLEPLVADPDKILTIDDQQALIYYTHIAQRYWSNEELLSKQETLLQVYNLLGDEKSRDIFASKIVLMTEGADYGSFCNFIMKFADMENGEIEYFDNDIIRLDKDELLVDGGAYTGDTALELIRLCSLKGMSYRKILCYEPDPLIFRILEQNMAPHPNIELRPFGLWSHNCLLSFADTTLVAPGSSRIVPQPDEGSGLLTGKSSLTQVQVTSLDEDIPCERVTLIKMDIEGAEIEALRGAVKTIQRCRPKLVISVYHKKYDMVEIPLLINRIVPEYKLYLRHYSGNLGETVAIAIPA